MSYIIRRLEHPEAVSEDSYAKAFGIPAGLEKASITKYPWDKNHYMPVCAAYVGWNQEGLKVYLYALETKTRAVETRVGGSVCQDSCLEFFLNPAETKEECYFNYECSVLPCVHLGKGPGRSGRYVFDKLPEGMEPVCTRVENLGWCISYTVTREFLLKEFGVKLESGRRMWGNFYKCGDKAEFSHYGIWHEMDYEKVPHADYHRPEYFGEMVLE